MVLRFTIFGLLLILIAVIAMSHYSNKEGFQALDQAKPTNSSAPAAPATRSAPATGSIPVPSASMKQVPVPATGKDLSNGSSLVATAGAAAGPAPFPPTTSDVSVSMKAAGSASAPPPQFNKVIPQIGVSPMGAVAADAQQKTDFLSSVQKIIRNELLAARSTDTGVTSQHGPVSSPPSQALSQGKEYSNGGHKTTCPDMDDYIKKDSIPCWGCALDY
jgi:hypothetical protein